jgi:hypothetical protein
VPGSNPAPARRSSPVTKDTMKPAKAAKRAMVGRRPGLAEPGPTGQGAKPRTGSTSPRAAGTVPRSAAANGIFGSVDARNAKLAGKPTGGPQNAAGGAGAVRGRRRAGR